MKSLVHNSIILFFLLIVVGCNPSSSSMADNIDPGIIGKWTRLENVYDFNMNGNYSKIISNVSNTGTWEVDKGMLCLTSSIGYFREIEYILTDANQSIYFNGWKYERQK